MIKRTGIATMPLHGGNAPVWLFQRMTSLVGVIMETLCIEFGPRELLRRLSDPYWFQSLGCVVGFDWHSSGLTTTLTGAMREALKERSDLGLFVAGGKGKTSLRTPQTLLEIGDREGLPTERLIRISKLTAKVDNSAVQDGYRLYHHVIVFTRGGHWAVIQQGLCDEDSTARRYHWLGEGLTSFVEEPHTGILAQRRASTLNLVAAESDEIRRLITELSRRPPEKNIKELKELMNRPLSSHLNMPRRHYQILQKDINPDRFYTVLTRTYEQQPEDFERLLEIEGVGPKTLRALTLISELIYGKEASYRDPARFSYAVGGKDRIPYPVDVCTYDRVTDAMERAIKRAKVGQRERLEALRRLHRFYTRGDI